MNLAGTGNTNAFAAALTAAFGVSSGSTGEQLKLYNGLNDYGLAVAGGDHPDDDDTAPKAFVTILLFDRNYNLLDAAWDQVTTDMEQVSATQKEPFAYPLSKEVVVHEPGFAYIFVSNEHPTYVDVYFDDVTVTHTPSPIVSASDYYPFGLTFNSFERENSVEQRWKFQGQEHIDDLGLNWDSFKWRNHQPDIGRFFNIDPLADKYVYNSPYAFSENKVISSKELEGLEAEPINESAEIRDVRVEPNWNREDPSKVDSYTATFTLVQSKTYNTYDENNVSTSTVKQVSTSQHSVVLPPGGMTMDSSKEGYANTVNMPVKGSMAVVVTTTTTTSTSSEGKNNSSTKKELKPTGDFRLSKANTAKVREAVVAKGQSNSLLVEKFVRFIFSEKKEKKKRTTTSEHHY
jgi:RHS repeat-associated protein